MASQGHARPLATTGAIMSTRKQDTDAGCDRWPRGRDPRGWPLTQTTARPSAAGAPSRHCTFGGYLHRHRQVARLARAAINQTTGSEPGRYVRCLRLKCRRARLCRHQRGAPAGAAACQLAARGCPNVGAVVASACKRPLRAHAHAHASISDVEACCPLCDHHVVPVPPVRRPVHTSPMTTRCRGAGVPPRSAHRMPTMPPRVCAATNASAHAVGLRPRCAHGPNRSPPAIQARSGGRRLRNTGKGLRAAAPWSGRASLRWSSPAVEAIIARPINRVAMRPASPPVFAPLTARALLWAVLPMGAAVLLSNSLVQYPINDWLTWGVLY